MLTELTDQGRRWAEANAAESIVAAIALDGTGWPEHHIQAARQAVNAKARLYGELTQPCRCVYPDKCSCPKEEA